MNSGGGSGRPHSKNRALESISIKTTPDQYRNFLVFGDYKWIKKIIAAAF